MRHCKFVSLFCPNLGVDNVQGSTAGLIFTRFQPGVTRVLIVLQPFQRFYGVAEKPETVETVLQIKECPLTRLKPGENERSFHANL